MAVPFHAIRFPFAVVAGGAAAAPRRPTTTPTSGS